jgi:hypothetical protein
MKIFSRSRIVGVQVGEVSMNLINPNSPPLTAVFALVRDDNEMAGRVEKRAEWSDKTHKLMKEFIDSLELDMADALFDLSQKAQLNSEEPSQI